jgi:hypothetical protein
VVRSDRRQIAAARNAGVAATSEPLRKALASCAELGGLPLIELLEARAAASRIDARAL